jgi:hypothetical protein
VLTVGKARKPVRPLIAIVAAYALALQVLLSGLAGAHAMAAGTASDDLFVICHGSGGGSAEIKIFRTSLPFRTRRASFVR